MIKKILLSIMLFIMLVTISIFFYAALFVRNAIISAPKLDLEKILTNSSTKIYDKNDNLILELGLKKSEYASYDEISPNMIKAITSVEDERFFSHMGVDYKRLVGATIENLVKRKYAEGASTINQQLIKNAFLTTEKSLKRKVQEMYLAYELESLLTKEQILEAYLNNILFGKRIYGVERASLYYFNKHAIDLDVEEAALLAGMIQLPNFYNPYENFEDTLTRRNLVIALMHKNKYLSKDDMLYYQDKPISLNADNNLFNENFSLYSSYLDRVIYEAYHDYNFDIYGLDLKVYTNVDPLAQKNVYDLMRNETNIFPNELIKAGLVQIDNKSGHIEAIGGQREFESLNINYATNVKLQPASTIKPILDYAPAFEYLKYSPANLILDNEITYSNGSPIHNWDLQYKGNITLRKALKESRNIPALKLYQELDKTKIYDLMQKMQLYTSDSFYEAHAIGGFSDGFTVLEMTNAYQCLANNGNFIPAQTIRKIEFQNKTYQNNPIAKKLLSDETCFLITDILNEAAKETRYNINGMYISFKTGQSNFSQDILKQYQIPEGSVKDSWLIGYSNNKTIGAWSGYNVLGKNNYLTAETKEIPKKLWHSLMRLEGVYDQNAPKMPEGLRKVQVEIIDNTLYQTNEKSPKSFEDYFLEGTLPNLRMQ